MAESSTKPYMIRALHEWCTDNGYTPHIAVHVDGNTLVPPAHIRDGQITLNRFACDKSLSVGQRSD
jgi:stringent starvation protein B